MLALHRLCSVFVILFLTLGTVASGVWAADAAGIGGHQFGVSEGMDHTMPGDCAYCPEAGDISGCAQAACGIFIATLPRGVVPLAGGSVSYDMASDEIRAGLPLSTDPPPPRTLLDR